MPVTPRLRWPSDRWTPTAHATKEAQGVDAVIALWLEAGGHRGILLSADLSSQLGTFALGAAQALAWSASLPRHAILQPQRTRHHAGKSLPQRRRSVRSRWRSR